VDIFTFYDHVSQVDADAKREPLIVIGCHPSFGYTTLPGYRASDSIHYAGELDQQPVTHKFDDASAMLGDEGVENLLAQFSHAAKSPVLVLAHKAAVAHHVGGQNGSEATLHGFLPEMGE